MKPTAPISARLTDPDNERARRELDLKIRELQRVPATGMRLLSNVALADGVATPVPHGLGRLPSWVGPSAPRGASSSGRIEEVRDGSQDRTKVVVLKATGWGATITVDVQVL